MRRPIPSRNVSNLKYVASLLPLLLVLSGTARAQYEYTIQQDTITITGYTGSAGTIVLPDTIDGLPVTTIGERAFAGRTGLARVTLPDSVTTIGELAFANCYDLIGITLGTHTTALGDSAFTDCISLTRVTIPDEVTTVGNRAFASCTSLNQVMMGTNVVTIGAGAFEQCLSLTRITLPASVTTLGERAFADCTELTAITVDPLNPALSSVEGVLFDQGQTQLIQYPRAKPGGSYLIPPGVTDIREAAFSGCYRLTSLTIPDSVRAIGTFAFINCYGLTNITVEANNAFYRSTDGILFNQDQTRLLQYPAGKVGSDYGVPGSVTTVEDGAFSGCYRLTRITLPEGITAVGNYAFSGTGLTQVTLPNGVTTIGNSVFAYCSRLASVIFPDHVTSIGASAFAYCSDLTRVTIPNGVVTIGDAAFERCSNLASVTLPGSVTLLGHYAFAYCSRLTNVTIPETVLTIGDRAFAECTDLTAIAVDPLNAAYRSVDGVLFDRTQTRLLQYPAGRTERAYSVPAGVVTVGDAAFASSASLVHVSIPGSVTFIGDEAFAACPNLTSVYFGKDAPSLGADSLAYSNQAIVYYLPQTAGWEDTFAGHPAVLWNPRLPDHDPRLGVQDGQWGFTITGTKGLVIVVEACTNLVEPVWIPLSTHTLTNDSAEVLTNGSADFRDPEWTHHPSRFYRFRSPY